MKLSITDYGLSPPEGERHPRRSLRIFAMGGLGNQLFQLAAVRAISRQLGLRPVVDAEWYRDYALRTFWLDRIIHLNALGVQVRADSRASLPQWLTAAKWSLRWKLPLPTKFVEHGPKFDARVHGARRVRTVVGHFQSYRYFSQDFDRFLAHLQAGLEGFAQKGGLGEWPRATVAVHLRLADYLEPENLAIYGPTPLAYVGRALSLVNEWEGSLPDVAVFTDEPNLAEALIDQSLKALGHFSLAEKAPAPVDLLRMSEAKYLVMANSSLSWWAAALAEARGGRVFFPRPWTLNPPYDGRDLARPGWYVLDR